VQHSNALHLTLIT